MGLELERTVGNDLVNIYGMPRLGVAEIDKFDISFVLLAGAGFVNA